MKKFVRNLSQSQRHYQSGLTLLELLVVLVILVLIAGLAAPRFINYLESSKIKTAKVQIENFKTALELYRLDNGRYPSAEEGLNALLEKPSDASNWNGPYLNKKAIPLDPWGQEYKYVFPDESGNVEISSKRAELKL